MTTQTTSEARTPSPRPAPSTPAAPSVAAESRSHGTPSPEQQRALDIARRMAEQGVPIVVAPPAIKGSDWDRTGGTGGTGYRLPSGWQQAVADPAALDAWRPGMALMAVMGHACDLVDADPRNGSDASMETLRTADAMPRSLGRATTPSGGTHDFIAPLGVGSRDSVLPGVDIKGGKADGSSRGFAFIAPTRKTSKVTGEVAVYAWEVAPDFTEAADDDTGEALAERIRTARPGGALATTEGAAPVATVAATSAEPPEDPEGVERYQRAVLEGQEADLKALHGMAEGARDERGRGWQKRLADAAYRAGQVVAMRGGVLTEADFRDAFDRHAPRGGGVDGAYLAATWRAQYARGTQVPAVLPERRDGGQVERATTQLSPAAALRAKHPLLGPSRPQRKDLFLTFIDDDGKEVITDHLLVELVARYFNHNLADGGDRRLYAYRDGVYVPDDSYVMRCAAWALGDWYSPSRNRAVSEFVSVLRRPPLPDVPDLAFINVANGMVKVDSGELLPHDPAYLSAVQLPTPYEPGATCPRFDAWLAQVLPEDTLAMFWEVLGYLLLHGNPLQVAVLLHGSGGNGKGTLLRVLHHLLGRHNVSAVTLAEITEGKFEVAGMYGRQANIAGDIDPRYLKNTAKFKAITGGDVINAQHKNAKPFEFTCWAVPIFSANELWRSADVSRGYFRRWVPIPFPNSVVDSDEPFDEAALLAETPGILAKALPALGALQRRGRFDLSPSSRALLTAFEEQADSVLSWMGEDDWLSTHDPAATTAWSPRTKLHHRYRTWCIDSGHVALSSTKFYARIAALGYQEAVRQGTRGFYGLALLEGLAQ